MKKNYGVPTSYHGVTFRSRLEARWAAFFDQVRWDWEYEPFDLPGWIPDFLIRGVRPLLVEVKPVEELPDSIAREIEASMLKGGRDEEVLLLGTGMPYIEHSDQLRLRWIAEACPKDKGKPSWWWQEAILGRWTGSESERKNTRQLVGFCPRDGVWHDRITGCYDGGSWGEGRLDAEAVRGLWAAAGNCTQWRRSA